MRSACAALGATTAASLAVARCQPDCWESGQ